MFSDLPATVVVGESFPFSVWAIGSGSEVLTNDTSRLRLDEFRPRPEEPVISEVDLGAELIEVTNPGSAPLNLGGWQLLVGKDDSQRVTARAVLILPEGTTLPPGASFTWSGSLTPPGAFPAFATDRSFRPEAVEINAVRLLDPEGVAHDEVFLAPTLRPTALSLWRGTGLPFSPRDPQPHVRVGVANHFQRQDWVTVSSGSPGRPDPGLRLPWHTQGDWLPATPASVVLSNGVWSGTVSLPAAEEAAFLIANNGGGRQTRSTPIRVRPAPGLELMVPEGMQVASEATAGGLGEARLRLPTPTPTNLTVTLSWDSPGEFATSPEVIVPAGADEIAFAVTNLDDTLADGTALVRLRASAPGRTATQATFVNQDDETGVLWLLTPEVMSETEDPAGVEARVWLESAARHDVLVELTARSPLQAPPQVIIPAGGVSGVFKVRRPDDDLVNPDPWNVAITATTGGWPATSAFIKLEDDEEPWISLELPPEVTEGETVTGRLKLEAGRARPFVVHLDALRWDSPERLGLPLDLTVPAEVRDYEFPLTPPDDEVSQGNVVVKVRAHWDDSDVVSEASITVLDDDTDLAGLGWFHNGELWKGLPGAVTAGEPYPLAVELQTSLGQPFRESLTGRLELLASPLVAQPLSGFGDIQFTNGVWQGEFAIAGEALGAVVRVSVGEHELLTYPFDVLPGAEHELSFADARWWPAGGKMLLIETVEAQLPRLLELEPMTGARGRTLPLPGPATRLALADTGDAAWLTGPENTLIAVDLAGWEVSGEFPLVPDQAQAEGRELIVLPGGSDRVVVAVAPAGPGQPVRLQLHRAGLLQPEVVALSENGKPLLSSREPAADEVFCLIRGYGRVYRVAAQDAGLSLVTTGLVEGFGSQSLVVDGDRVIAGNGQMLQADTLESDGKLPVASFLDTLGCLPLSRPVYASLEGNQLIRFSDPPTRQLVAEHKHPGRAAPDRFFPWGDRGLAVSDPAHGVLDVFQSPVLTPTPVDVEVRASAPKVVVAKGGGRATDFTIEGVVINHGDIPVPGVRLHSPGELLEADEFVDVLGPGESRPFTIQRGSYNVELMVTEVSVTHAFQDPVPENNTVKLETAFQLPDFPGSRQLILGLSHLVAAPDGNRLYAALDPRLGAAQDGVAVVNPFTVEVEQTLVTPENLRRLAVSNEGEWLYGQLGESRLTRWHLPDGERDLTWEFDGRVIRDFAPLPHEPRSVVVAAGGRVEIYDDAVLRPAFYQGAEIPRQIGFAGDQLWIAESGRLLKGVVTPTGLRARAVADLFTAVEDSALAFDSDGSRLFFNGWVFDPGSRQVTWAKDLVASPLYAGEDHALYTATSREIQRVDPDSLVMVARQAVPDAVRGSLADLVRWGDAGLAARSGPQLLLLSQSSVVPAEVEADLAVVLTPPADPHLYESAEWTITVTNRSPNAAPRAWLTADWKQLPANLEVTGAAFGQFNSSLHFGLGELPGHSERVIRLRGELEPEVDYGLSVQILSAAADPHPEDNEATAALWLPRLVADLALIDAVIPHEVRVGEEFVVSATVTNAGPANVPKVRIGAGDVVGSFELLPGEGYAITSRSGAEISGLAAGEQADFALHLRTAPAGLLSFALSVVAPDTTDPDRGNDAVGSFISVLPTSGASPDTETSLPDRGDFRWDGVSGLIVAEFDNHPPIVALDPATLLPVHEVTWPGSISNWALCQDGKRAWVFGVGGFSLFNYQTGDLELRFTTSLPGGVWSLAVPPGQSDTMVICDGSGRVRAFDRGEERPVAYGPVKFIARLLFTHDGRLFTASQGQLRELRLEPDGVVEVQNLDTLASYSSNDYQEAGGRLFAGDGRVIDIASGSVLYGKGGPRFGDPETALAYLSLGGPPLGLRAYDAATMEPRWEASFPVWQFVLPLGSEGFLGLSRTETGGKLYRTFSWAELGPEQTDVRLDLLSPHEADDVGQEFPVEFAVTNASRWAARAAQLEVRLSPGLEIAPGQPAAGATNTVLNLGSVLGETNLTLRLRPRALGRQEIVAVFASDLPDVDPDDNAGRKVVMVGEKPWLLLDDEAVPEDGSDPTERFQAWLSRPRPHRIEVPFQITPETSGLDDFNTLTGTFVFDAGQQVATADVIRPDGQPEPDETATVRLQAVPELRLVRSQANLTILNDDWPQISAASIAVPEGDVGQKEVPVLFSLNSTAPFPVDLWFRTTENTAEAGADFLPREGWLSFAAGERLRTIRIPILGDRVFEPDEVLDLSLIDVRNGLPGTMTPQITIRNDDASPPLVITLRRRSEGGLVLEFPAVPGAKYQLQTRTNLVQDIWRAAGNPLESTDGANRFLLGPPALGQAYFRVHLE